MKEGKYKLKTDPEITLWYYGHDDNYVYYCTNGLRKQKSKIGKRNPKSWDFSRFGFYFRAYFPDGKEKKIFLNELIPCFK